MVTSHFPDAVITFAPDDKRAAIVDSWPADLDDSAARRDWGWHPQYDAESAFRDYLVPNIRERYGREGQEQRLKIEDCDPAREVRLLARSQTSLAVDPIFNL
ncbi:MAG: hypothetical protein R2851_18110 [Caldilineaceae bacterium]